MTWLRKSGRLTVALALLALGFWIVYETAWLMASGPDKPITSVATNSKTLPDNRQSGSTHTDWSALFGEPSGEYNDHTGVTERADLGVSLLGVFDHAEQGGETIIIKLDDGDQQVFRIGDALIRDFRVMSISKQEVVLSNDAELLLLPLEALHGVDGVTHTADGRQTEPEQEPPKRTTHEKIQAFAGLEPVKVGVAAGYRLGEDSKETQESLGLQEGDVILSMNGYPLGTEADDKLASHARGDGPITLKVRRNGENTLVTVNK